MRLSRRSLLAYGTGIGAGLAFHPLLTSRAVASAGEGFLRVSVAGAEVIALSDGSVRRPLDAGFVRNAPLDQVEAALAAQGLPTDHIQVPYTPFVVEADGRRFLMDTGFADNGPDGTGRLREHMQRAGIDPAAIDVVLISHFHGDHIQGLRLSDGTPTYPNATVYVSGPEYDHWMDDARMAAVPEAAQGGFRVARRVFADYPQDKLVRFTPGDRLEGLFDTLPAFGHSPGQSAFAIGSGADSFTYLADIAHYPALFVTNPDWHVLFDMNPDVAQATRHEMLGRMSAQGGLVGGYHFPFPSLGTVAGGDDSFAFTTTG